MKNQCNKISAIFGECYCMGRSDRSNVAFNKLEKVGEPYEHCGKLYQCYKLPMEIEIRLLPNNCNPIGKDNLIEIETKQNKEDMKTESSAVHPYDETQRNIKSTICENKGDIWKKKNEYAEEISTRIANEFEEKLEKYFKENMDKIDTSKLKPFDIQKAREGKPVCTRDGRKARIICFDRKGDMPITALITNKGIDNDNKVCETEEVLFYYKDGRCNKYQEYCYDLMMLPEKKEGWMNVYKNFIYKTKEDAFNRRDKENYLMTIKVSWEE